MRWEQERRLTAKHKSTRSGAEMLEVVVSGETKEEQEVAEVYKYGRDDCPR